MRDRSRADSLGALLRRINGPRARPGRFESFRWKNPRVGLRRVRFDRYELGSLKIGIDATVVAQNRIVGISRFVVNLVGSLVEVDPAGEYFLCYRPRALKRPHRIWKPDDRRFHVRILQEPFNRGLFRSLDAFHATYQRLPGYRDLTPYLGTLHDIFYMSQPEMGSRGTRKRSHARYVDVARRSALIMTLSEFSKQEIVRLLGVDAGRVRVVPLAASSNYVPVEPALVARSRVRYGLERPYILFGGGAGRRKNLVGALQAFALAAPRLPADLCFAVTGSGGPLESAARELVRTAHLADRVAFLGFIPDDDYPALMSGCTLFYFPSLLEGFGLPALEAMSCGAPVVTSSTTSLPEVCGDAALLVDPADVPAMSDALVETARTTSLRDEFGRRGRERASEFSWRRVAQQTLDLYRELSESR
jgi:hypothetical protein